MKVKENKFLNSDWKNIFYENDKNVEKEIVYYTLIIIFQIIHYKL